MRVLGRDAQDTERLARRWRLLAYRDPPRSAPVGRLEQVEHEALATFMAAQAGVRVPEVVIAALGPDGDALVVTRQPASSRSRASSADQVSDATLEELCQQVARLHEAGISHGRLNLEQRPRGRRRTDAGRPGGRDARRAAVRARRRRCRGPRRVHRARRPRARARGAVDAGWGDAVARVLPYLQRAALTPHLRDLARSHEVGLEDLRAAAAKATGQDVPAIVPMRRIRAKDFFVTAMVALAAYLDDQPARQDRLRHDRPRAAPGRHRLDRASG